MTIIVERLSDCPIMQYLILPFMRLPSLISPYSMSLQNIGFCRQKLNIHLVKGEVRVKEVVVEILPGIEKFQKEQKRELE